MKLSFELNLLLSRFLAHLRLSLLIYFLAFSATREGLCKLLYFKTCIMQFTENAIKFTTHASDFIFTSVSVTRGDITAVYLLFSFEHISSIIYILNFFSAKKNCKSSEIYRCQHNSSMVKCNWNVSSSFKRIFFNTWAGHATMVAWSLSLRFRLCYVFPCPLKAFFYIFLSSSSSYWIGPLQPCLVKIVRRKCNLFPTRVND